MEAIGLDPRTQDPYEIRRYSWVVALARLEQTPECAFYGFRGSPLYEPADHAHPPFAEAAEYAIAHYLAAFGPATRADVSQWSGVPIRDLAPGFERLRVRELRATSRAASCSTSACAAGAGRRARASPAPAALGRAAARAQGPHPRPPRRIPEDGHPQERGRAADVPDRRDRRRALARGGRADRARAVRRLPRTVRRELEDEAARLAAWLR